MTATKEEIIAVDASLNEWLKSQRCSVGLCAGVLITWVVRVAAKTGKTREELHRFIDKAWDLALFLDDNR